MAYGGSYNAMAGPSTLPPPPLPSSSSTSTSSVPDIPGDLVQDRDILSFLRGHVANLTHLTSNKFPGAQPVSFTKASLDLIESQDFWVCEKSDGQRVLVLIVLHGATGRQDVFLVDRKNNYYFQQHVFFPTSDQRFYPKGTPQQKEAAYALAHQEGIAYKDGWPARKDTLLDGELVWDTDRSTGRRKMRLLLFDALVVDGQNMAQRPLTKRYGRLHSMVYPPLHQYLQQNPKSAAAMPFEIRIKHMDLAYGVPEVLQRMPNLEHGNDGLIFTCMNSGYTFGTDEKIIKWKPPRENSVDFVLRLRFPPDDNVPGGQVPNLRAKPFFLLEEHMGGSAGSSQYEPFDWLWVGDEAWEEMKRSGVQWDDRVVECVWDLEAGPPLPADNGEVVPTPGWKIHRIRDDKHDGNHSTIVQKILSSIMDGVDEEQVVEAVPRIRAAWKSEGREKMRKAIETGGMAAAGASTQRPRTESGTEAGARGAGGATGPGVGGGSRGRPPVMRVGPKGVFRI
ncbi:DNA ligase/mRNA capping enzyme [Jaminaea rosea]|uniref:mRNA guanylyltransferase n=1 Tax=Jaminaea rosea TaxID=1569628 RepID=A0A316UYN9_9BASI|nr:DNA ligase/mRNA capping enzyme [Jaminaea rosea]PWN29023.1 DNA ligase/mRNA capping enzyme [Jaminaea rosea]